MLRREWKVLALVGIPGIPDSTSWQVAASRFTKKGAHRTAKRWTDKRKQWEPFRVHGYGYAHEDEKIPTPNEVLNEAR